ncbi:MAG: glycosyltransferase family 39 protein [Candidatus Krumholzibacteriota bacterium]|nr:glycosyltransferase family 39 protein [Candidatus Krumholzibacteriota bacterium]
MSPDRRTLLAIFALTFGVRILYAVTVGTDPDLNLLAKTYDFRVAEQIHTGFGWIGAPFTPNAPGYILSLAVVLAIFVNSVWSALLFQATVGGIVAITLYRIGERHLGKGVGLFSAVWFALYVHNIHFTSILLRDTFVVLLWMALVRIVLKPFSQMRSAVWAGVFYAALVHTEPMFMLLAPLIIAAFLFFATNKRILNVQYTMLFVVTILALSLPWTIRNYAVYKEPIPVALEATRYMKPFTRVLTGDENAAGDFVTTGVRRVRAGIDHNALEFWRVVRVSDYPGDATRGIQPEPAWSLRHNVISVINYGLLIPLVLVGIVIGWRRRERAVLMLAGLLASYFLLRAFIGADERSRLPAEPILILIAFYGVAQLIQRWRGARDEPRPSP